MAASPLHPGWGIHVVSGLGLQYKGQNRGTGTGPSYVYPDLGNHIREDTCMQVLNNGDTGNPACQKSEQKQRIWSHEIPSSNNPSLLPIASLPL